MSGSVRQKARSRQALVKRESIREEPKKAQWSNQEYTIEEILDQFSVPQIVKWNQESIKTQSEKPLPVNFTDPLMLYDKRTVRKLLARNISFSSTSQRYSETSETIVIPEDYEGLFLRLQLRTCKDNTSYKSIAALARNRVRAFLNMTNVTAFRLNQDALINDLSRVTYTPGNVFIVENICNGTSKRKKELVQHNYLKCKDEKGVQIVIHFDHPGEFAEVLTDSDKMAVSSSYLVANQKFPMVVRFISSKQKPRLKSFSGLFTLIDSFEETTVVGCILNPAGHTMFEIPVSSPLLFNLALNNQDLNQHPVVKHAIKLRDAKYKLYANDMKYKFKFPHRFVQRSETRLSPMDEDDDNDPTSALNSARFDVAPSYIYI